MFDRPPGTVERGLDVDDAALLQLRKACRLLDAVDSLLDDGLYTLVVEASFVAIERTVEFRLLEGGRTEPSDLPGTHTGVYDAAARAGLFDETVAADLADLWRDHRAKTYYQDGIATERRADRLAALAHEAHEFVVGRSQQGYECLCRD